MATITVSGNTGSTVGGVLDTALDEFAPTTNFSADTQCYIDTWNNNKIITMLLIIPIPSGSGTVINSKVRLYLTEKGGAQTDLSIYEILRTDVVTTQATATIYKTSNNWTTSAAQGSGTDRSASAIATGTVSGVATGNYIELTGSGLTALIQDAVTNAKANIYINVQFTNVFAYDASHVRFRTTEGTDGQRPELVYDLTASSTDITCNIGSATASGLAASIDQQQNIACSIGTATASGLSAAIDQQQNITCAIGTANASGLTATVDQQQNITCSIGTAVASGLSGSLGGDTTISANIGTADASGLSATIDQQQNIACAIGTATASGLSAAIDNNTDITCAIGTAVASGLSGTVEGTTEINCSIGTAVASGLSASLGGDTTITCSIGTTNASGLTLTIDQQQNITCSIGVAVASGLEVSFNAEGRIKQAIKEAYASAPAGTIVIHTLEFRHPNFRDQSGQPTAIRVVLGHQNLEARLEEDAPQNAGEYVVFIPMAFDLELPNIEHLAVPEITIAIDNVSRDIEDNLTLAAASPYKVEVTYRPYLNTDLTQPQWNPPPSYTIISAEADDFRVTARASFGNAANVLTPREVYTSDRFPGLQR